MNRRTLMLGGGLLALAVLALITSLQSMTGDTNYTAHSNRNGSHSPPSLKNEHANSVPAKSQRRKDGPLLKRSTGWILAREIEQCCPDPSAVVITRADYRVESEGKSSDEANLPVESWNILGYTNDSGLEPLTIINTREGIRRVFARIHAETGDESFSTDSFELVVNLLASENKKYSQEEKKTTGSSPNLPFVFDLTVSRRGKRIGGKGPDNKTQQDKPR